VANSVFRLIRGGKVLALLTRDGRSRVPELDGHFTTESSFQTTTEFESVRHLFERELALLDEEGDAEQAEWLAIWDDLKAPGLFVESADGLDRWDILWIHFEDGRAWWWPLFKSPQTVLRACRDGERRQ
jgi:hypothetical protein